MNPFLSVLKPFHGDLNFAEWISFCIFAFEIIDEIDSFCHVHHISANNCRISMMIKKVSITIVYWAVSILLVGNVLESLGYYFSEALLVALMFLPGALAARYLLFKISFKDKKKGLIDALYVTAAILIGEIFLIITANMSIQRISSVMYSPETIVPIPGITVNPVFIAIIITVLCMGDVLLDTYMKKWFHDDNATIRFNSNRTPVTLRIKDILYVESNDSETWVYASDGEKYRNKTPISHWEANLGDDFIRIHRSYLVNRSAITSIGADTVMLADTELPVSRKYRDALA